jgi:glucose/arabinose dehydrogenase
MIACLTSAVVGCHPSAASRSAGSPVSTASPAPANGPSAPNAAAVTSISGLGHITNIVAPDDGSGRLFVTDQVGIVRIVRDGAVVSAPALDIHSRVGSVGNEQGLLGIAFPAGFATKQRAYLYFTDLAGTSRVFRIRTKSGDPDVFDPATLQPVLSIAQPYANHNGGQLAFGPDGYLYLGFGDGGGAGDPGNRAQDLGVLLGKILRIDVESRPSSPGYLIPADNPFVKRGGARPEIWAYGLRNPWRFSFDAASGDLWIADVGQDRYEEVDYVRAGSKSGLDFGWNLYEGNHLYKATSKQTGFTWPVTEYAHPYGECVTGGYVYRGSAHPAARGLYVFGDYVAGKIFTLERSHTGWTRRLVATTTWAISTFGVDGSGELWAADHTTGSIHLLGDMSK